MSGRLSNGAWFAVITVALAAVLVVPWLVGRVIKRDFSGLGEVFLGVAAFAVAAAVLGFVVGPSGPDSGEPEKCLDGVGGHAVPC